MRKVFKLLSFMLLSTALIACSNISSSTVASSSISSPSSSSISFEFQTIQSITISTQTDLLNQSIANLKPIIVSATTNEGINPNTSFEWYVNGNKSLQEGKVFEFTPNGVGTYNIQARVANVNSNQLSLVVGDIVRIISVTKLEMNNNRTIEITAEAGLQFEVKGFVLAASSNYNVVSGKYSLVLNKEVMQGTKLEVTIKKDGYPNLAKEVVYDTRKVEVNEATIDNLEVTANNDGSYTFEKPNVVLSNGLRAQTSNEKTLRVKLKTVNLDGVDVPYSIENFIAPTNVSLAQPARGNLNIVKGNAGNLDFIFRNNINTVAGNYKFRITINGKQLEISVNVVEPKPSLKFEQYTIFDNELEEDVKFDLSYQYAAKSNPLSLTGRVGVNQVNGVYTIEKEFLEYNFIQLEFKVNASNFKVDANFLDNPALNPNQLSVVLQTPDQTGFIRTDNNLVQLQLPTPRLFRGFYSTDFIIRQRIDHATEVGQYRFIINGSENNVNVISLNIVINIIESKPKISPIINITDASNTPVNNLVTPLLAIDENNLNRFKIYKPTQATFDALTVSIDLLTSNIESKTNPIGDLASTYFGRDQANTINVVKDLIKYKQSITGPTTFNVSNTVDTLIGLEAGKNLTTNQLNEYSSVVSGKRVVSNRSPNPIEVKSYQLFRTATVNNQNQVLIPAAFNFVVDYLTIAGVYTFNIEIGNNKTEFIIEVVEAINQVVFEIDTTSNAVVLNEKTNKYEGNLNKDDQLSINFLLNVYNANFLTKNQLTYSLVRSSPAVSNEVIASSIAFEVVAGNDGHVQIPQIISILNRNQGSLLIEEVGTYIFELNIEGKTSKIELVVLDYPTLDIKTLDIEEEEAIKYYDDNFVFETIAAPATLKFEVSAINLTGTLYYRIIAGDPDFTDKSTVLGELKYQDSSLILDFDLESISATQKITIMIYEKPSKILNNYKVIGHKTFKIYFLDLIP